jgi:hypothetical protein
MADLNITINPPPAISVGISPPQSTSITVGDGIPPHNITHSPAGSDSLATWYATVNDLSIVSGSLSSGTVSLTGNQNISGVKNFYSRPTLNDIGLQTTGEYEEFNSWKEYKGTLYPNPNNDLNRNYSVLLDAEDNSGPSGATIWYNIPQWTGAKPVGTGISSFYNTGFWARDYDWSCVSFKGARARADGFPSICITLISKRHAIGVQHWQLGRGDKVAFVSNVETGYTWEATIADAYNLNGDLLLYSFTEDAPSQIRPASIIRSPVASSWQANSLLGTRGFMVKDSTVLNETFGGIKTGVGGFIGGALDITYSLSAGGAGARYTGFHVGGDSSSPVFIPLRDGRLVYVSSATFVGNGTFVGDPNIISGINVFTTGYSIDYWDVPKVPVFSVDPTNVIRNLGTETNKWYEINCGYVKALNLDGLLSESNIQLFNEVLYGEDVVIADPITSKGLTYNSEGWDYPNLINFSGTFPNNYFSRFVIPNSGASINFTSSGPTLLMPNGSGFSGAGYVIEARGVDSNKILIQPISVPFGTYATGNVIRPSQTGNFVDKSSAVLLTGNQNISGVKNFAHITALSLQGDLRELDISTYNEYFYGETVNATQENLQGLTINTQEVAESNTINFSGNYRDTFWARFVIPNSGASINFSSSGPTLLMPNGSGFSGVGYVIEARAVGYNKILIQPIAFPSGTHVTGNVIRPSETGQFTGVFYPYSGNPAGYVQGAVVRPSNTGNFVDKSSAVLLTGNQNISGTKNFTYVTALSLQGDLREWDTLIYNEYIYGETINITQNDLNGITVNAALPDITNIINFSGAYSDTFWARFVIPNSGSSINFSSSGPTLLMPHGSGFSGVGYVIEARSVDFNKILIQPISFPSGTYSSTTGYLTGYVNKTETGSFITTAQTGQFVSTGSTGQFVTGSVVRPSQTGAFLTTGAADNRYALQSATGNFVTTGQTGNFLTSGTPIETIQLYAKNDESFTLYKGQAVYIGGANGTNALIKRASNTGELTSSKTIGLLAQNLNADDFGYIISEGILEGINTSAATAGDPMWLGTTGDLIFGTGNKPYGNNHLVYLGVVLRSQSSNGKVYIKPQNGFEIEELHRVYAKNAISKDTLMYDSTSGSWFARQISTGDVSGISSYATNSSVVSLTGDQNISGVKNFYSRPTVNGTGVLLSGESITTQPNDANLIIGLSLFL